LSVIKKLTLLKINAGWCNHFGPKRQLLVQKHIVLQYTSLRSVHPFFAQLTLFYPTPKILCCSVLFNWSYTPKATRPVGASTPVTPCNICSLVRLSIRNCLSIGSAIFVQLTAQSPYSLQCALKRN